MEQASPLRNFMVARTQRSGANEVRTKLTCLFKRLRKDSRRSTISLQRTALRPHRHRPNHRILTMMISALAICGLRDNLELAKQHFSRPSLMKTWKRSNAEKPA